MRRIGLYFDLQVYDLSEQQLIDYVLKLDPGWTLAWLRKRPTLTCRECGAQVKILKSQIPPLFPWTLDRPTG